MHSTLLVGPYDWDPELWPEHEFREREAALWPRLPDCAAALVYGDRCNHAELAYLTHCVPKLGPAVALLAIGRDPVLLVADGPNLIPCLGRMTWIEQVQPLGDAARTIAQWLGQPERVRTALVGGDHMRPALSRTLAGVMPLIDGTPAVRELMRVKRPRELVALRDACTILDTAMRTLAERTQSRAGATEALLQAEHAAYQAGAQDVRTLFSLDGGRTLRPFEMAIEAAVDPLLAYIAVRRGYWAEGFVTLAAGPHPLRAHAENALCRLIELAQPAARCRELARHAADAIAPYTLHPVTAASVGNGIGLALDEAPLLAADSDATLEPGGVYTLRVGATDGRAQHAIVSAMVAIHPDGNSVLWGANVSGSSPPRALRR